MLFPGLRRVEQTEQKFRRFESVLKMEKKLILKETPTKNSPKSQGVSALIDKLNSKCAFRYHLC